MKTKDLRFSQSPKAFERFVYQRKHKLSIRPATYLYPRIDRLGYRIGHRDGHRDRHHIGHRDHRTGHRDRRRIGRHFVGRSQNRL